jgi:hypothetical protein
MAKTSGMGDNCYVGGYDLSGDVGQLGAIGGGPSPLEVTGIDKSAIERLGGKRDGRIEWSSWFNPAASQAHPVLSALPTADVHVMYCRGTTLGSPAAGQVSKQINYDGNRGNDGALTFALQALANGYGIEWGTLLTPGKQTDTTATNGTGVDFTTVSTAFGWQAYLQVFAVTGTSVTVQLQDSADNVSFANLGAGGAFTAATGITTQRLASPGSTDTVRRYLRAITSGTFSNAVYSVLFVRNTTAVTF